MQPNHKGPPPAKAFLCPRLEVVAKKPDIANVSAGKVFRDEAFGDITRKSCSCKQSEEGYLVTEKNRIFFVSDGKDNTRQINH